MWRDSPYAQPEPSFLEPIPDPGTEPDAEPLLCASFNELWQRAIVGALTQLVLPTTWQGADGQDSTGVLARATRLVFRVGLAGRCVVVSIRFTASCGLQYSTDGELTWIDVPGWAEYFAGCVQRAAPFRPLVMTDGVTFPPIPVMTETGDDWVYAG